MTTHSGPIVAAKDSLIAIDCSRCGFIHLDPIPTDDPYTSGEYHRNVKPDMGKEYDEDGKWWDAVYGDWLSMVDINLFIDIPYYLLDLLDTGAGTGHFVKYAYDHGWMASGIESDPYIVREELGIANKRYIDVVIGKWVVISAHWVLEHLPDPVHFLRWSRERLTDNGLLLLTIPNDFSNIQMTYRDIANGAGSLDSYWLNEHHNNYWNNVSFTRLLKSNGYEVLARYGSWEPELALLAGRDYLNDHSLGRKLHADRMARDLAMTREERLQKYLKLGEEGRGRDLTFLARKVGQ